MSSKHMKKTTSLAIREMEHKKTLRTHLIPGIMVTHLGEAVGQGGHLHTGGNVNPVTVKIIVEVPQKPNIRLPYDPALILLSTFLKVLY